MAPVVATRWGILRRPVRHIRMGVTEIGRFRLVAQACNAKRDHAHRVDRGALGDGAAGRRRRHGSGHRLAGEGGDRQLGAPPRGAAADPFVEIGKFIRFDPEEIWTWVQESRNGAMP